MAGFGDLIGMVLQGGLAAKSAPGRLENALNRSGLGQSEGMLGQILGNIAGGNQGSQSAGMLGGLMDMAKDMLAGGSQGASQNPLASGGLGALAGALFGGGSRSGGALKGAAIGIIASLAMQAFKNMNRKPQGSSMGFMENDLPLGARPPQNPHEEQELENTSAIILKAMINAAKADGHIDQQEMEKLLGKLKESGADPEMQQFVIQEMQKPLDLDELVQDIPNEAVAAQAYLAALFTIEVDTEAERQFLNELASRTGLDQGVVSQLHQMVGLA